MKSKIPLQNLSHHYEDECSDDDTDLKKYIKVCVQEELNTISQSNLKNKKATRIITPSIEKQKNNQDNISDCGKDICKMSNQQIEMHMRSKFHNDNI